jgi:hypothetical protein
VLVLLFLLPASIWIVEPRYPADVFTRVWVLAAVFYAGAIGQFVVLVGRAALHLPMKSDSGTPWQGSGDDQLRSSLKPAVVAVGALIVLHMACSLAIRGPDAMSTALRNMIHRGNVRYDAELCRRLLAISDPNDDIVYDGETLMYHALVHGLMDRGALLNPNMSIPMASFRSNAESARIRFLLFSSPIRKFTSQNDPDGIRLEPLTPLDLTTVSRNTCAHLEVHVRNPSLTRASRILVVQKSGKMESFTKAGEIAVPAGFDGWTKVPLEPDVAGMPLDVRLASAGESLQLGGLKTKAGQTSWWPWDDGIGVRMTLSDVGPVEIRFDTRRWREGLNAPVRILDDRHAIVLAEIIR